MNRGIASTWHKWDFHVHTPYSILNNGYGVDPFTTESEASFDQYIQSLFLKILSRGNIRLGFAGGHDFSLSLLWPKSAPCE